MAFDSMEDKHVPPTPQQAIAALHPQFVKDLQQYNVSNPHPGYGTDPNILNCFGHTKYPMWCNGKIVNNADEEAAALGKPPAPAVEAPKDAW